MANSAHVNREVTNQDESSIAQILSEASAGRGAPRWSAGALRAEIVEAESLAERGPGGQLWAFIFLRSHADAYEISYLATAASAQRRGLMRKLLMRAAKMAAPQNKPLWLEVHELNLPACRLYESFGFKEVGRRPKYYADGGAAILYNYG